MYSYAVMLNDDFAQIGRAQNSVARLKGNPRSGLWRVRVTAFRYPNAVEDQKNILAGAYHFHCHFLPPYVTAGARQLHKLHHELLVVGGGGNLLAAGLGWNGATGRGLLPCNNSNASCRSAFCSASMLTQP